MKQQTFDNRFLEQVTSTIDQFGMLSSKDRVLAAVSGGPDSMALVLALLDLSQAYQIEIGLAHINHGLREKASDDEEFVADFAEKRGLPFYSLCEDVAAYAAEHRLSVETAGRKIRYRFFEETADRFDYSKIALGHHKDDNAEQVLMNLIRGSGTKGISGIPPVRQNRFIRPLIQVTKSEIQQFLDTRKQPFVIDDSNTDTQFLRNRIRNDLIPELKKNYNPEIVSSLDRLSTILRQEENLWEQYIDQQMEKITTEKSENCIKLDACKIAAQDSAIAARIIRQAVFTIKGDLKRFSLFHIDDICRFAKENVSGKSLDFPGRIRVYRNKSILCIKKEDRSLREIGRISKADKRRDQDEKVR